MNLLVAKLVSNLLVAGVAAGSGDSGYQWPPDEMPGTELSAKGAQAAAPYWARS